MSSVLQQIYNVDESGDTKPLNVITKKDFKKVRYRVSGRKGQPTIVGCANAIGIPPMVIFDARNLSLHAQNENFTNYGLSDKGWNNTELFEAWLSELVFQCTVSVCLDPAAGWSQHRLSATNGTFI